jgi:hypothetical protein
MPITTATVIEKIEALFKSHYVELEKHAKLNTAMAKTLTNV